MAKAKDIKPNKPKRLSPVTAEAVGTHLRFLRNAGLTKFSEIPKDSIGVLFDLTDSRTFFVIDGAISSISNGDIGLKVSNPMVRFLANAAARDAQIALIQRCNELSNNPTEFEKVRKMADSWQAGRDADTAKLRQLTKFCETANLLPTDLMNSGD